MKHSVELVTLKTGAKGLLIDVPGASVMNTKMQFRAGLRYARKADLAEIAHIVEHLSFGANAKYQNEQEYEADFTKNGAYHNAWTSDFSVCYETECADFEWDRILDLKRIAICNPRFNEDELKSEKGNVRAELTGYLNDYQRLVWTRLQAAIGENVPSLQERLKTVNNVELKDIREHYRRTHTASNLRFIITGQVKHRKRKIIKMLEDWDLKEGERLEIPIDSLHTDQPILIRRKDASNITFGFSFVTPRKLDLVEVRTMECLNHILTGTMNSRIFGEIRKRGLAYSLCSVLSNGIENSSWDFDGEVNLENADELFNLIQSELIKVLNSEITDAELDAAKSYALGRYQMGAQTVAQISELYMESYFQGGDIEDYNRVPEVINSIDKTQLVSLAREFAGSGIRGFVAVGSCEKAVINDLAAKLRL
ncbi:MAG: pitrilysin family protein [Candidatus Saccharibacteria bacterium]|nr:pitrilysin family protein [Candidatus Saccharibacteria bacterium]